MNKINLKKIRASLTEQFTAEELYQICLNFPEFRPLYDQLAVSNDKAEIITRLVEYADQNSQLDKLLAQIKEKTVDNAQPQAPPTPDFDLVGKTFGKYYIASRLSHGGAATVYKAFQTGLYRFVAIKVMHSHLATDEHFVERFEREAIAVANLRHPNIVQVFDFDLDNNSYYMVMEFIDGPTLEDELEERKKKGQLFSLTNTVSIFDALGSAIDYAHSEGMIHRDLKPSNIMFTSERKVVLTDFGIARIRDVPRYTITGTITGTPTYMSPEQARGEIVDETSDVYSLGVILYEMTTGRIPFEADTPYAMILKLSNSSFPAPTSINPNLPPAVEQVVLRAMSKNPAERFQTASELAQALQKAAHMSKRQLRDTIDTLIVHDDSHADSQKLDPMVAQHIGQVLNQRYKIIDLLGMGGMGTVFKGIDITLQRSVAIKIMHPHLVQQPGLKERFLREAQATAKLSHANIVQIFDYGQEEPFFYIIMEFIPGNTLHHKIRELRRAGHWFSLSESAQIIRYLCLALDYAHQHNVLHRDIKPNNIMLRPQPSEGLPYQPVIADLGLAKILTDESITNPGASFGTPAYMSPEQALGQAVDARSDVYSLGALLCELVTGLAPFPVKTIAEAVRLHSQDSAPPPPSFQPGLPESLKQVILQALAKDRQERFLNAAEMAEALALVIPHLSSLSSVPTDVAEPTLLSRRPTPEIPVAIPEPSPKSPRPGTKDRDPSPLNVAIQGDVTLGDKTEGDRIEVGDVSGTGVAIGRGTNVTVSQSLVNQEHHQLFKTAYQRIEIRPNDPNLDKEELTDTVKKIQQEVARGEQANPNKVERWLKNLSEIAPDVSREVVADLNHPDITPTIRQIAANAGPNAE